MSLRFLRWLAVGLLSSSCAPLTFSNEASVDFDAYPRVLLQMAGPHGSELHGRYLTAELTRHSGFRRVTADANEAVDATLWVELTLGSTGSTLSYTEDDGVEFESATYFATVVYELEDSEGALLDVGTNTIDEKDESDVAAELALDAVVARYLRPYRL